MCLIKISKTLYFSCTYENMIKMEDSKGGKKKVYPNLLETKWLLWLFLEI